MRIFLKNIIIITSVIVLFTNIAEGQNKDTTCKGNLFSAEIFINEPYYFIHSSKELDYDLNKEPENFKNYWNYGGGILISTYIHPLKISTGIYFNTKNYYRTILGNKEIDQIQYYNIPIIILFKFGKLNPFVGAIYNKSYRYNNGALLWNETPAFHLNYKYHEEEYLKYSYNNTFRIGCNYNIYTNNQITFYSSIYFDYRQYKSDITYVFQPLFEERISIGLNIGIEYIFNKK